MKKIINIFVSIVFLISFVGVNIHKHYSDGKLYSAAIFQEAESCCADMNQCQMNDTSAKSKNQQEENCSCEDETETYKISDTFINQRSSVFVEKVIDFHFACLFQAIDPIKKITKFNTTYLLSLPPLIKSDIQSEFGVFLI